MIQDKIHEAIEIVSTSERRTSMSILLYIQ